MARPWLIVGCGYTGTQLARTLAAQPALAGAITITRRDREVARALGAALGVRGERAELAELAGGGLEVPPGAIVVCAAPPGGDPAGEIAGLVAAARDAARIVYVSSTGVYGAGHGAWVDETWPVAPITESGRARAAAEAALAGAAVPWVALRAAGIYGPGRGLVDRIRAGTYRVIGDGTSCVGRIHVVDLVAAIVRAATTEVTGAVNVADDDPAPIGEVADAVAARLGLPPPPRVAAAAVSPEIAGMLTANRRIANRRMRDELGVALRYPSWRDGLAAELTQAPPAP
ncbi:MAG TPA: NAD-dependent epimerase/dehydratase family protein [Kofleriaceae bacterium]|nr:NAD-dependent epimerase/dehydratase family protein [Kofleriaceae bacterium]HMG56875.1 NAD-dependent epimerase/dehydratase family protein [Kofleriaceae bacterium]